MHRVIARIFGGIGNQLFCYTAARRLAIKNNAELVIDDISGFSRDNEYHRHYQLDHFTIPCRRATATERMEPFSLVRRYLRRSFSRCRPYMERSYIQQEGIDYDPRLLDVKLRGTLYLEGYWQSEKYFKDVEETIRADLKIAPPTDAANLAISAHIRNRLAVAVHVRFFDVPSNEGINNAPGDYYARAVALMEANEPGVHYFVFSDRPDAARTIIPLPDERITCVLNNQGDDNAYADLWLMSQCRHVIMANSTFSWWGAWLGDHPGKRVIAPQFSPTGNKTAWDFEGLLPKRWIVL